LPLLPQALAHSPQFHQQLAAFGAALQSGQLDLAQFGLQAEVSAVVVAGGRMSQRREAVWCGMRACACAAVELRHYVPARGRLCTPTTTHTHTHTRARAQGFRVADFLAAIQSLVDREQQQQQQQQPSQPSSGGDGQPQADKQ
jgi:hypothetical protein